MSPYFGVKLATFQVKGQNVDNFLATSGDTGVMAVPCLRVDHFGHIQRELRTQRGLSQVELADMVHVSEATIQRAEREERCPYRRSTAIAVLSALHNVAPISRDTAISFLAAAGLSPDMVARLESAGTPAIDPVAERARRILELLIARVGPHRVVATLETLAVGLGVTLAPTQPGRGMRHVDERIEDGYVVKKISPVGNPPTPPDQRRNQDRAGA